ncbi:DUF4394 domain-containing protein [Micromonospora sp. WMMD812]|uniref:DUF4394 domain-containing protein n=1 Tax=Micromonospora sp. WMMD812 TaxID=3015152 RepID=UPI00248B93D6|nr:DUF4394 domain-containing protein [Micromonospora sp. WMMD812]WBB69148.1 DUF4394 domain-containing protein [Micromonospora sp. WMMD812]
MKYPLHRGLLLAGLSVALSAGMSGSLVSTAAADGSRDDSHRESSRDDSHHDWHWEKSCDRSSRDWDGGRDGLKAVGLTDDQKLIKFDVDNPRDACKIGKVRLDDDREDDPKDHGKDDRDDSKDDKKDGGKGGGDGKRADDKKLVGIDFRVQNDKLYGVGDQGGIYILSTRDASAKKVSQLTVDLDGKFFGVDFNPAANRLRVISDTGQNLRHNIDDPAGAPAAGMTATDTMLTTPPATTATTGVTAAAYTNNDLDPATATTLFDINTNLDQVVVQSPANAGLLAAVGALGVDAGIQAGFDIYSKIRDDRTVDNKGFAVLQVGSRSNVYKIDLLTGEADKQGSFRDFKVVDLALPLDQH